MGQARKINDIVIRFKTNWRGFLRQYYVFLILTFIAAMADMFSTVYFMHIEGAEFERHPTIRLFSMIFGPMVGPIVGKLWQLMALIIITIYLRKWALYIFVAVIILYSWAAWYNIWGRFLYYPVFIQILDSLGY